MRGGEPGRERGGEARGERDWRLGTRVEARAKQSWAERKRSENKKEKRAEYANERSEHASKASLNRLRGVANERVRNARVNKRRGARGGRQEAEHSEKWCAQRPGEERVRRCERRRKESEMREARRTLGARRTSAERRRKASWWARMEEKRAQRPRGERVGMLEWTTVYIIK